MSALRVAGLLSRLALVATLAAAAASPAWAQCMPDNLTGPCWQPTQVRLPQFPRIQDGVKYICWDNCSPRINRDVCIDIGAPVPTTACGVYRIAVTIRTCGAAAQVLWTSTLTAHYSRNWIETDPAGNRLGVWRFILNGDMIPSSFVVQRYGTNPCAVPPCFFTFGRFYVQGYIDYAQNCQTLQWRAAAAIDHGCDAITHGPASARPAPAAGFHPTRSYTWVVPALGFVPYSSANVFPPSAGPIVLEALRVNNWAAQPNICVFEEPVQQGNFLPLQQFCLCPSTVNSPQYVASVVQGAGVCGSTFDTGTAPIGPIPFVQKRIGNWTIAATFPGVEFLLLDMGNQRYFDSCRQLSTIEYFEGVETIDGYPAISYTGITLPRQFEDLASSNVTTAPLPTMIIGVPHISWYIENLNLP
ncbi:MAG: hypothetical protein HYR85_19285 [Planctomycetes bacterium]|nr:hypothetical protein [Planctomycetota bacterium]MBI3843747.1 hypothetical protein [Planctomycetota bacterium]